MDKESQVLGESSQLSGNLKSALLKETCALHEGNKFEYLCIDTMQQECMFKCIFCVTDEDVKQYSLIPLKQVANAEEKTIFANFPLTDRTLTQQIKKITQNPPTNEVIKQKIDSFFNELTSSIIAKLESVKACMVAKAKSISNLSGDILSMYNSMSEKENLKIILADSSKPSAVDKSPDIKALCTRVLSKDTVNQQAIQAAIEKASILEKAIDLETLKQIKERIFQHLEQIDMFLIEDIGNFSENLRESNQHSDSKETVECFMNEFNDVSQESCQKFQDQHNLMGFTLSSLQVPVTGQQYVHLQSLTENQTFVITRLVESLARMNQETDNQKVNCDNEKCLLKSDELFELISNKTNYCSNEYLNDLKGVFDIIQGVFQLFRVRKLNPRTKEQNSFNHLNQDQLKNITKLVTKVIELSESFGDQYLLSNQPQQQVQSNSEHFLKYVNDSRFKNVSSEELQNIRRDFQQLLVNYPIFEILPSIQTGRTLPPMTFTRSVHSQSSEMGITYNGCEVQITLGASKYGQCNSQILDSNQGYLLKLRFNRPFGSAEQNYFRIGLILNQKIPTHWVNYFFQSYINNGTYKIIRGLKITSRELRNTTSELEFRWCVAKRQFFISDATYSNINQVEESKIDSTGQYCFAVCFYALAESDWKVTINDFKEIDPNDVDNFD